MNNDEVKEHNSVRIEVTECNKKLFTQKRKRKNQGNNIALC
jgi:hypothetical protein